MSLSISEDLMNKLWPHGDSKIPGLRKAIADHSEAVFAKWGFDTPDVIAIFLGQVSLECGAGTEVVENLNYTARRMMAVWPSRFPTLASALPYANNPFRLAEKVYGSRGGNKPGSGMGAKYIGRGGSQTTFHDGYAALAEVTGLDLLDDPNLVNDPRYFLDCAAADFVKCGCLPFAKRGDIESVTHHLNGGLTGLSDRVAWTKRIRSAMAIQPAPKPVPDGILRMGSKGYEVTALENRLVELGYAVGKIDDQFGRAVRMAVIAFQLDRGLPGSGEVDDATKEALKRDLAKPVSEERLSATADDLRDSGSGTIAKADSLSWYSKILTGLGVAGGGAHGAQKVGLLDTVKDTTDQVSAFRGVFDQVHDSLGWVVSIATTYWWVVLLGVGFLGIKFGGDIIRQRLADHRCAVNMAR
jgi:putative chitinase